MSEGSSIVPKEEAFKSEESTHTMVQRLVRIWKVWGIVHDRKYTVEVGRENTKKNSEYLYLFLSCEVNLPMKFS